MTNEIRDSRFRYVDADDLENRTIEFGDLDVRNAADEKLGDVDGFVVDDATGRPYYVVVDSGGWFSGGKYLVPINHTRLERDPKRDEDVLRADLGKDTIKRYPKFDKDEFARLSDAQLVDFENRISQTCCPGQSSMAGWDYEKWEHYRQPDWWTTTGRTADTTQGRTIPPVPPSRPIPPSPAVSSGERVGRPEPERIIAREGRPVGDRAEPGDVLGIESGGEETHLGDTASDEPRRVRISDREAREAEKNNRG